MKEKKKIKEGEKKGAQKESNKKRKDQELKKELTLRSLTFHLI